MRLRSSSERRIFFPWESRGGLLRWLRLGRMQPVVLGGLMVGLLITVGMIEKGAAGLRQTRARVLDTRRAIDGYLAEHPGTCPPSLQETLAYAKFKEIPRDAWGRPLRLVCPGKREGSSYELMSDGPDGLPGGLDRIE